MNKIIIPILASILILGVLGTAEDAFAPKKLFVGGLSWDTDTQSFVVTGDMNHGMAEAIENSGFTFLLMISSPNADPASVFQVGLDDYNVQVRDLEPAERRFYETSFVWDRILDRGLLFEGHADFTIELQILNPAGKPVAFSEPLTVPLNITPPPSEICDDGRDNDNDGLVDGDDPDCQGRTVIAFFHDPDNFPIANAECAFVHVHTALFIFGTTDSDGFFTAVFPLDVPDARVFCTHEGVTSQICDVPLTENPQLFDLEEGSSCSTV